MIDTHTHLYLPEFETDGSDGPKQAVERALAAGVDAMIFPNVDLGTIEPMRRLASQFPGQVYMTMGLHPTEVNADWSETLAGVEAEFAAHRPDYVAIGEVGIDLYWDKTFAADQARVFHLQCRLAQAEGLPVIIHCRNGLDLTLEVLADFPGLPAVFHSFGGSTADVERILALGDYHFGINGILTFKNSSLRSVVAAIPHNRLLLETDSPYLAPVPRRGRRNESAYVVHTAQALADALGLTYEQIDSITTHNAREFFKISQ